MSAPLPVPDQLGLPLATPRLYAATPSRLTSWSDCPRRFRFTYLERPPPAKGPPWAHTSLGVSLHNALRAWWLLPRRQRTPGRAGALLEAAWVGEGYRDDEQAGRWRERARSMVTAYVDRLDPGDEPLGVERTVAARTPVLALSGRVDRLDRRGAEVVVVDYKTGRTPCSTDDARGSLALALYAVAAAATLRLRCRTVELHHLPSGGVAAWEHSGESLARQLRRAEAVAAEAQAAEDRWRAGLSVAEVDAVFPPRPRPGCSWCDVRRHCPEGRAGSRERPPWDGLDPA